MDSSSELHVGSHSFAWNDNEDIQALTALQTEVDSICPDSPKFGASTLASRMRFCEPDETLIFLDFDDTLFPTSDLFERCGISSRKSSWKNLQLSVEQQRELESWRHALLSFLTTACSLSDRVVVVTNSRRPWVHDCLEYFAPNVLPLFRQESGLHSFVHVEYAHEHIKSRNLAPQKYEPDRTCTSAWEHNELQTRAKYVAMRKHVKEFYNQYSGQTWKNILSIGDAQYEADALQELSFHRDSPKRERLRTKISLGVRAPSISQMALTLHMRTSVLPAAVYFDGDFYMDMGNCDNRLKLLAETLGLPELMQAHPLGNQAKYEALRPGDKVPLLEDEDGESLQNFVDHATVVVQEAIMYQSERSSEWSSERSN